MVGEETANPGPIDNSNLLEGAGAICLIFVVFRYHSLLKISMNSLSVAFVSLGCLILLVGSFDL